MQNRTSTFRPTSWLGATGLAFSLAAAPVQAGFVEFVIREGGGSAPTIQANTTYVAAGTEFVISAGGQKAATGSSDLDGLKLSQIGSLSIVRHDDVSRFPGGSGPAVAPYLNFWITDGTNFAVAANEPSNAAFQDLYNNGYDLTFADLEDKVAKIYENDLRSWLPNNGVGLTFADLANFTILAPTAAEQTWAGLGSGAPRELGTKQAYGINWVFGDTMSNYVSGNVEGYVISGASATAAAVPEPQVPALLTLGLLALLRMRRKA